jgi:hypothetical protein
LSDSISFSVAVANPFVKFEDRFVHGGTLLALPKRLSYIAIPSIDDSHSPSARELYPGLGIEFGQRRRKKN